MIHIENFDIKKLAGIFFVSLFIGILFVSWLDNSKTPVSNWPIGVDIYPRWTGSHAFWRGESPYSKEVDLNTQSYVYGRAADADEDSFGFYYPAHAAIVLAPLTLLSARWAALLWAGLNFAIISVTVFMVTESVPERASFRFFGIMTLSIFLFRPALLSIINGQFAPFVLALWGLSYYMIRRGHENFAGFLLALTTIKPSLSLFPLLVLLFWALMRGHRKVLISFFITSCLFFLISIIRLGWWVPEFLSELGEYSTFPRPWITSYILSLPGLVWAAGTVVLIFLGIKEFWEGESDFPWTLFWGAISLNLLVTAHTSEYDLLIIILPFILYSPRFFQTRLGFIIWLVLLWLPWFYWRFLSPLGSGTDILISNIWMFYPQILVFSLLVFIHVNKNSQTRILNTLDTPRSSIIPISHDVLCQESTYRFIGESIANETIGDQISE